MPKLFDSSDEFNALFEVVSEGNGLTKDEVEK